jgi:hypothetical protein
MHGWKRRNRHNVGNTRCQEITVQSNMLDLLFIFWDFEFLPSYTLVEYCSTFCFKKPWNKIGHSQWHKIRAKNGVKTCQSLIVYQKITVIFECMYLGCLQSDFDSCFLWQKGRKILLKFVRRQIFEIQLKIPNFEPITLESDSWTPCMKCEWNMIYIS